MNYKIVGTRMVAGVKPGGELSAQQIEAAGASVSHLIASGHIAPVGKSSAVLQAEPVASEPVASVVKASKKAASFIPADEAVTEEII